MNSFLAFLCIGLCLLVPSFTLEAYQGAVQIGALNSQVRFSDSIQGEQSNDRRIISSRVRLEFDEIAQRRDLMLLDIRDRYDFFGRSDSEILSLSSENELSIRQVAYGKSWENNRPFYTLGRFQIPELAILANDGALFGYRLSRRLRVGSFIGIAPADIVTPASVRPEDRGFDGNQAGVFAVYQKDDFSRMKSSYISGGLAQAPTFDLLDYVNKVYFYQQSMFNFGPQHHLSSLINYDIMPSALLRQAYLRYRYTTRRVRVHAGFQRISAEDYRVNKDIRDELNPSSLNTLSSKMVYRLSATLNLSGEVKYSQRSADSLSQMGLQFGTSYRRLLGRRLQIAAYLGQRDNYLSQDSYYKFAGSYFGDNFTFTGNFMMLSEEHDSGDSYQPIIFGGDLSFTFLDDIIGTASYSMSQAEDKSINTAIFSMAYSLGASSRAPRRRRAASFEDI